jgi:tRNA threonylcarbamoyladenosine biosynthesis protein TsaE
MADQPAAQALSIPLPGPADTRRLGARLAALAGPGDLIALTGDLGAGKSELARALIRALPGEDGGDASGEEVPSPTFTLVQRYDRRTADRTRALPVWHFDLYRLAEPDEIDELGWEEALAGGLVLIEWPDRLGPRLPAARLDAMLSYTPGGHGRLAVLQGPEAWGERLDALASAGAGDGHGDAGGGTNA